MRGATGFRWLVSVALTIAMTVGWRVLAPDRLEQSATAILWVFVLAVCLPLAWRLGLWVMAGAVGLQLGLSQINHAKIAMTQAPLTALDFAIASANPQGLWIALGWPLWTRYLVGIALVGVVGGWVWLLARSAVRGPRFELGVAHWSRSVGATAVGIAGLVSFSQSLPGVLAAHANQDDDLWQASALGAYSTRLGTIPFLLYSHHLEQLNTGPFYTAPAALPPSRLAVHDAAARYVALEPSTRMLPNIAVVFAESTFNPNWAFALAQPVASDLFTRQPDTHAISGLFVNAVGGSSWITEFESIVGVDSRLFGYSGYYTHSTLSPFVRRSFVTYLRAKGYDAAAYYSWAGNFYNARRAYANYGFDRFFDVGDLGLREFAGSDEDVAASAVRRMKQAPHQPFFSYVVLYENHPPHRCEHFTGRSQFSVVFAGPVAFAKDCELNEYLRRMASTTRAVAAMDAHLRDVERATGRPYVLVTFGDHQPHTFTSTKAPPLSNFDYVSERTQASPRETFLHIRSSARNPLRCCAPEAPPAFLLPTLMSAYAAESVDDLYLPENLLVYQHCGSETLPTGHSLGVLDTEVRSVTAPRHPDCPDAYRSWLAAIRAAGIF